MIVMVYFDFRVALLNFADDSVDLFIQPHVLLSSWVRTTQAEGQLAALSSANEIL